jgi:hypothetical protein
VIILALIVGAAAGFILFVGANLVPLIDNMCSNTYNSDIDLVNDMAKNFV